MATTDLERLVVSLEASTKKYENALNKAFATTNQQMGRIEKRVLRSGTAISSSMGRLFAGAVAGLSAKAATDLIDSSIKIQNSLKIAGLEGESLTKVYEQLYASAQRNAAPLEALATLYGRVAQVQGELGINTQQLTQFTDNVAVALRISGRTAEESKGALLQLGQALGGTIVRAEEFNSINEGALPILQSVAAGLKEAGGSVARLRALVIDGKVSSKAFFDAFEAGAVTLEDKVANAELTVSQGFTRLYNVLIDTAGKMNEATGISGGLGSALDGLASFVDKVGTAFLNAKPSIDAFYTAIQQGAAQTSEFLKGQRQANGETTFFEPIDFNDLAGWVQKNFFGNDGRTSFGTGAEGLPIPPPQFVPNSEGLPLPAQPGTINPNRTTNIGTRPVSQSSIERAPKAGMSTNVVKPVSLDDYTIPGTDDKTAKKLEKLQQATKDYIEQLEFEKSLIGLTEVEQQKLTAQREAGAAATAEQKEYVAQLTEEIYYEQEAVKYLQELYDMLGQAAQSAIQGIIGALDDGKISAEEFGDVLSNVLSMAGQFFLNQAFGGGSNGFSSILTSIFGGGKARGGGVKAGMIYPINEHAGRNTEYFAPGVDGMVIPRLTSAGAGGAQSSGAPVYNIDARGAQIGVGEEIRRALDDYDRHKLPKRVNQINKDPLARG